MSAPRYLVTMPPGVPVAGVGFVRHNSSFSAPEGFVPSRTFKALNAEASAELQKLKDAILADAKKARAVAPTHKTFAAFQERAEMLEAQAAAIEIPVFELPKEEQKVETNVVAPVPFKSSSRKL